MIHADKTETLKKFDAHEQKNLERLYYLGHKIQNGGVTHIEYDERERLIEWIRRKLAI